MEKVHIGEEGDQKKFLDLESARKGKKTVAFVGMAPRTRERAPFDVPDIEIWTLGRSWRDKKLVNGKAIEEKWVKRISRHYEIHPKGFQYLDNKPDEPHFGWLKEEHDFPIYMDDKYPEFPASVRYPIEWAVETYGRHFTSSMSYFFPIAEQDGFDRIEIYGFEMGFGGEYAYQMPEVAYHIGWFRALHGYDSVVIPPDSKILRAPLYAYEEMYNPILTTLEQRITILEGAKRIEEMTANKYVGAMEALNELNGVIPGLEHNEGFKELQTRLRGELRRQEMLVNSIQGAQHDDKVIKDTIYYMMPPSYKRKPTTDLNEQYNPVTWDEVDLPWKEAENVTETREES